MAFLMPERLLIMADYDYISRYDSPNYTPAASVRAVYGMPRNITAITIHHWGIKGQKFLNIVNFLCRKGGNTSAHEVIESGKVAVIVDHKNAAWHAGNGKGNATTIGLELRPEATDGDYATAAERIAELRAEYGDIPLVPHRAWKNTACPGNWDLVRLDREARAAAKGEVKPASPSKPKPAPAKPYAPKPAGKSVATMAAEVIAGNHGNGHDNRRKSLGVSASVYAQVRDAVNGKAATKTVSQMATEVIQGKHGNGHPARQKSLGVTNAVYAKVRAEVNRRA